MKKADLEKQVEEYRNKYHAKCSELNEKEKSIEKGLAIDASNLNIY